MWNIGFESLFTKYQQHGIKFPVTQVMQIELGMMGAVSIMGMAVQFQILKILMRKMKEIEEERKRQDEVAEARAAERFKELDMEKNDWERLHPSLPKHGRADSNISGQPLLGLDGVPNGDPDSPGGTPRPRYQSGLSEFMAAPTPTDELHRAANRQLQNPGALPTLDLGDDIEANVPETFIAKKSDSNDSRMSKVYSPNDQEDFKERDQLLSEIHTIRRSIELLRSETPGPSNGSDSRRASTTRRLSQDFTTLANAPVAHLRPPRERDPRARVQSMELGSISYAPSEVGPSIGRPTSAPLRDDWDMYVHERKLFQPPSGVTAPIPTTAPPRAPVSPAVMEALKDRQRRESALSATPLGASPSNGSSSDDLPLALRPPQHKKSNSQGGAPVTILPPKRPIAQPTPQTADSSPRVKTFEELVERHREKLHELQAPITQAQKEQADISAARNRWERAKNAEKAAMEKRQAEKEQAARDRTRRSGDGALSPAPDGGKRHQHQRSLSADVLAAIPGAQASSRRMSTLKVEDWQRAQQDEPPAPARPSHGRQGSSSMGRRMSGVPFPDSSRDKRRGPSAARDPVS